jgi:hypothetical protein
MFDARPRLLLAEPALAIPRCPRDPKEGLSWTGMILNKRLTVTLALRHGNLCRD